MSDKEMLEFAAKAAGVDVHFDATQWNRFWVNGGGFWNPLVDDGDAFRLMVKLKFDILQSGNIIGVYPRLPKSIVAQQPAGDDPLAATRRAIVRAAAEIGKGMK